MLSGFDDFPIHQTTAPVAYTSTTDINFYDRYFFNGYECDGSMYFGLAMGLYANRHVADAAFSVMRDGEQISVFTSQRAPDDRRDATHLGPIDVDIVEPMRVIRVSVDAADHGMRADLTFTARSAAIEEPHYSWRTGVRAIFDYTRFTQFGTWTGWIEIDGTRYEIASNTVWGSRDRSWGVRPFGEPAASGAPVAPPQFFWLWAPVNFPSVSTHFDVNEYGNGDRWHVVGAIARTDGTPPELMRSVDYRVEWRPGTRWAKHFEYDLVDLRGDVHTIRLEPRTEFHMCGLGYGHPAHGHGMWQGESLVAGERIALPVGTPCSRQHIHVQALCDATYLAPGGSSERGVGILEQLAIGNHPTGLHGIFDAFDPQRVLHEG
ncbi:MAG: hypothetical protein ABI706_12720 [Ilumatobacteraceae bacterium]